MLLNWMSLLLSIFNHTHSPSDNIITSHCRRSPPSRPIYLIIHLPNSSLLSLAENDSSIMHCLMCNSDPCHHIIDGDFLHEASNTGDFTWPNDACRMLYCLHVSSIYGYLSDCNRIEVVDCIGEFICQLHPDPKGDYMGHKPFWNDLSSWWCDSWCVQQHCRYGRNAFRRAFTLHSSPHCCTSGSSMK